jgi:hypothetical protein
MNTFENGINGAHSRAYFIETLMALMINDFLENLAISMVIMLILKANDQFRVASPGRREFVLMLALPACIFVVIEKWAFGGRDQSLWPIGILGDAFGPLIGAPIGIGCLAIQSLFTSTARCNDPGDACTAIFMGVRFGFAETEIFMRRNLWLKAFLLRSLYMAPWISRADWDGRARHIRRIDIRVRQPWYIVPLLTQPVFGAPLSSTTYYSIVSLYPPLP